MNKGFWKRIAAVMVICSLLLSGMGLAEPVFEKDSSVESFDLILMTAADDVSAENWMIDEQVRALGAVMLAFDLQISAGIGVNLVDEEKPTFIGRNGAELICYLPVDEGDDIVIFYEEGAATASYKMVGDMSTEEVAAAMSEVCPDGFYSNDAETMVQVGMELYRVLDPGEE